MGNFTNYIFPWIYFKQNNCSQYWGVTKIGFIYLVINHFNRVCIVNAYSCSRFYDVLHIQWKGSIESGKPSWGGLSNPHSTDDGLETSCNKIRIIELYETRMNGRANHSDQSTTPIGTTYVLNISYRQRLEPPTTLILVEVKRESQSVRRKSGCQLKRSPENWSNILTRIEPIRFSMDIEETAGTNGGSARSRRNHQGNTSWRSRTFCNTGLIG